MTLKTCTATNSTLCMSTTQGVLACHLCLSGARRWLAVIASRVTLPSLSKLGTAGSFIKVPSPLSLLYKLRLNTRSDVLRGWLAHLLRRPRLLLAEQAGHLLAVGTRPLTPGTCPSGPSGPESLSSEATELLGVGEERTTYGLFVRGYPSADRAS